MARQGYLVLDRHGCLTFQNNIHILPAPQIMRFWKQPAWPIEMRRIIEQADDACASIDLPFNIEGSAYVFEMAGVNPETYKPFVAYSKRNEHIAKLLKDFPWIGGIVK